MQTLKALAVFVAPALAGIVGCFLPYLWLKPGKTARLLVPIADSLALFAWLLPLHPTAAGRVYVGFLGMAIIMFGPRDAGAR